MKYVFINLKNFAVKNVLIFILFIVCAVTDVLIILFSQPSAFAPLWKQPKKVEAKSASTYSKRLSFTVTYSSLP